MNGYIKTTIFLGMISALILSSCNPKIFEIHKATSPDNKNTISVIDSDNEGGNEDNPFRFIYFQDTNKILKEEINHIELPHGGIIEVAWKDNSTVYISIEGNGILYINNHGTQIPEESIQHFPYFSGKITLTLFCRRFKNTRNYLVENNIKIFKFGDYSEKAGAMPVEPEHGDTFTSSLGMTFVYIAPGSFMMGSPSSESGRNNDETQHKVTLPRGYWMQTTEVTQAQWKAVMGNNPSHWKGDDLPVEKVSWDDAQEFIRKLNQQEDEITYSLPTEAQWEYAARAGSSSRFCFGDSDSHLGNYAWFSENSGNKTHPVGQKTPNSWGLYDMHGSVWEWCRDRDGECVIRGGSGGSNAGDCRSALRRRFGPKYSGFGCGFRLVSSLARWTGNQYRTG